MCKTKEERGLGVKNISMFNRALLAKWNWRLRSEEKGKWKEILVSKYYSGAARNQNYGNRHSWWWIDLSKTCEEEEG